MPSPPKVVNVSPSFMYQTVNTVQSHAVGHGSSSCIHFSRDLKSRFFRVKSVSFKAFPAKGFIDNHSQLQGQINFTFMKEKRL